MARGLTAGMVTATSKRFTNPIYLIEQDMGAAILRNSTREQISHGGNDYLTNQGLAVENISNDGCVWSLDNSDRSVSILALGNSVGGLVVNVYLHYEGETITRFTGVIDEWHTQGQRVVFTATSQAAKQQKFPNERAELGTFNHLPPAGTTLTWGRQTITIQSEEI